MIRSETPRFDDWNSGMKPRMAPRSAVQVVVAFIAAPLIAGCVIWLGFLADDARYRPVDWGSELQFLWVLLLIAESLGVRAEAGPACRPGSPAA
jgi:hypothetical protein